MLQLNYANQRVVDTIMSRAPRLRDVAIGEVIRNQG